MGDVETAAMIGAVRGLESLARTVRARKLPPLGERTWDLLRWAATAQRPAADPRSAMTRRLAMAALVTGNQATGSIPERGLNDADVEVRRFAAVALGTDARVDDRDRVLKIALADKEPRVRLEALRGWGRFLQKTSCAPIRAALADADMHVRLQAIDQLASPCPAAESPAADLAAIADSLGTTPRAWHAPAHALVSLARIDAARARAALPKFVQHTTWQVRMYAARAAGALGGFDALDTLSTDPNDNVREAVLTALIDAKRPEAVTVAMTALR